MPGADGREIVGKKRFALLPDRDEAENEDV
jgi:hypothetical protein